MPDFIPGLKLSEIFYHEAVRPVLDRHFPGLRHSAARIGTGSEVLGFDTPMSRDHDWGPRLQLFLNEDDHAQYRDSINAALRENLPHHVRGYPTSFTAPDPSDSGTQLPDDKGAGPVNHRVDIVTICGLLWDYVGYQGSSNPKTTDWLTFPQQKLRTLTTGAVYYDDVGLTKMRAQFAWYPRDVWLYMLAAGWMRISQAEHLMGRAGYVGDEIGSALIGAALVRSAMQLGFLMERQYMPYEKWFGTAFHQLACAPRLEPHLTAALHAPDWPTRETHLCAVYEALAEQHNALGLTGPLPTQVSRFHGRPFMVIHGERFAEALVAQITDPQVQRIATLPLIGGIDQFGNSTDLAPPRWRSTLAALFDVP